MGLSCIPKLSSGWALELGGYHHVMHTTLYIGLVPQFVAFNRYTEWHSCGGSAGGEPGSTDPRPPRAEVEVSVAPRSPILAPRGASGWGRCPPGPNEVVWSAWRGVLHLLALRPGTPASRLSLVVGALLGFPALAPTNKHLPVHKFHPNKLHPHLTHHISPPPVPLISPVFAPQGDPQS